MTKLYDPLTYDNLMAGLARHFEQLPHQPLATIDTEVEGSGVYALFYRGTFPAYQAVANGATPVYVGKAVPPGSRSGGILDGQKPELRRRLREHAKSIDAATNLNVADFVCKHLAVEPVWITLAEQFLIQHHKPVWNLCLDGFGNHDPGGGRRAGERSWWDTLHPGRIWADKLAEREADAEQAQAKVIEFLRARPPQ